MIGILDEFKQTFDKKRHRIRGRKIQITKDPTSPRFGNHSIFEESPPSIKKPPASNLNEIQREFRSSYIRGQRVETALSIVKLKSKANDIPIDY